MAFSSRLPLTVSSLSAAAEGLRVRPFRQIQPPSEFLASVAAVHVLLPGQRFDLWPVRATRSPLDELPKVKAG
ncbi:hypothetical protein EYF80_003443 [Liparis tanakae]|uniref:Uncharacterized protein n=1 Tax=Liparis tanakae TaxID=230148 RepID=A0A4Z2J9K3_9TELE|nr:hypothetical protein EYF80_003443 [Liparis tanakae]